MQRTLHLHAYSLRKNNITVDFIPEASLPNVTGDSHQLMQIFLNLILNAEQAIREARDRGTLRIRMENNVSSVIVTFQDDGPGIPPKCCRTFSIRSTPPNAQDAAQASA